MDIVVNSFDRETGEYSFIDRGITTLNQIPLRSGVISLNLNVNQLSRLGSGLHVCADSLRSLDLSSNRIRQIDGSFDSLKLLVNLSLSCNQLVSTQGLQNLVSLVKLNLSYNSIADISCLSTLKNLKILYLEGNDLSSMTNIIRSLQPIHGLDKLILQQHSSDNPIYYRRNLLQGLPRLSNLDQKNRQPTDLHTNNSFSFSSHRKYETRRPNGSIDPAYHRYHPYSSQDTSAGATPSIDSALNYYYRSLSSTREDDTADCGGGGDGTVHRGRHGNQKQRSDFEDDDLLSDYGTYGNSNSIPDVATSTDISFQKSSTLSDKEKSVKNKKLSTVSRVKKKTAVRKILNPSPTPIKYSNFQTRKLDHSQDSVLDKVTSREADGRLRNDLEHSLAAMSVQLDEGKRSRLQASTDIRRLREQMSSLISSETCKRDAQQLDSAAKTSELRRCLAAIADELEKCRRDLDFYKTENVELKKGVYSDETTIAKLSSQAKQHKVTIDELQSVQNRYQENSRRKLEDVAIRLRASQAELGLTKTANISLKSQLEQLEQLIIQNQLKQQKAVSDVTSLDNPMIKNLLKSNSESEREIHERILQIEKTRYSDLKEKYVSLENEFKYALRIEESRHKELEDDFININMQHSKCQQIIIPMRDKNIKFNEMIGELTSLVKEQKIRIQELSKSKQDIMNINRERVSELQLNLNEARNRIINHEILKKEKLSLTSEKIAMTSIIEGLKSERKLWSVELAEQGVSLFQDRGRLENKIESLSSEIITLKKNLFAEVDTVKIKTKVIDDQTETIKKLKKDLLTIEEENKKGDKSNLKIIENLREELKSEKLITLEIQECSDRLYEKKEILKEELLELQDSHDKSVHDYRNLLDKWQSKSSLINKLESKVAGANQIWQQKLNVLNTELADAKLKSSECTERLKNADNHFRLKLDETQCTHQKLLLKLENQYKSEIQNSRDEVIAVENEMRMILSENQLEKKKTELSIKKLTQAFSEINENLK